MDDDLIIEGYEKRLALLKFLVDNDISPRLNKRIGKIIEKANETYPYDVVEKIADEIRKILNKHKKDREIYAALKELEGKLPEFGSFDRMKSSGKEEFYPLYL